MAKKAEEIAEDSVAMYEQRLKSKGLLIDDRKLPTDRKKSVLDIDGSQRGRMEIMRDIIASQGHHERFATAISKIEALKVEDEGFSLELHRHKVLAELHFKAMGKYVPDVRSVELNVSDDAKNTAEGISRAAEILGAIAAGVTQRDNERSVSGGSVVSTQARIEEAGS